MDLEFRKINNQFRIKKLMPSLSRRSFFTKADAWCLVPAIILLCLNLVADTANIAKIPTIAIINKHKDKTLADLLFAGLAKDNKISLVEREKLDLILKEQEYSSKSRDSNIKLGKLLKADALLFIEPDKDFLHIRVVETLRGNRMSDEVFPLKFPIRQIAEHINDNFLLWGKKLSIPASSRIYVSVIPIVFRAPLKPSLSAKNNISIFNTILSVFIGNYDNIITLERENLDLISKEKQITDSEEMSDLDSSDFIIRGKVLSIEPDSIKIELQIIPVGEKGKIPSVTVNIKKDDLQNTATNTAKNIISLITKDENKATTQDITLESKIFQHKGLLYFKREAFREAIQFFEIAMLLDPENNDAKEKFVLAVIDYLPSKAHPVNRAPWTVPWRFTKDEYMEMIHYLRKSLAIARDSKNSAIDSILCGDYIFGNITTYALLSVSYNKFTEEEIKKIKACRKELNNFFKKYCEYDSGCKDKRKRRILLTYSPVLFETPKECFDTIKPLLGQSDNPWILLRNRYFDGVKYWDRDEFKKLWQELLEEFAGEKSQEIQYNSLMALCAVEKSTTSPPIPYDRKTKTFKYPDLETIHFKNLVLWLQNKDNFSWLLQDALRTEYTVEALLNGFIYIPTEEQDKLFQELVLSVFETDTVKKKRISIYIEDFCRYFKSRYLKNIVSKNAPADIKNIRKLAEAAMQAIKKYDPENYQAYEYLFKCGSWYSKIFPTSGSIAATKIHIAGARCLFDYKTEKPKESSLGNMAMIYDNDIIWLAWPEKKGLSITRIDLLNNKSCTQHVPLSKPGLGLQLKMVKYKNYLCISVFFNIVIIPIINESPFLDIPGKFILGPKIGDSEMGMCFPRRNHKQVSTLIAGKEYLYIPLVKAWRGIQSGAVYRWKPEMKDCEKIFASDSFGSSPLDDCAPYIVTAGIRDSETDEIFFFLHSNNFHKVQGVWRYSPQSEKLEHLIDTSIPNHIRNDEITPPFLMEEKFYISTYQSCLVLDLKTHKIATKYKKTPLRSDQMLMSPIPVFNDPSKIWAAIREKGPLYLHSVNQITTDGEIKCLYVPIDYETKVQSKISTPKGMVVAILSDFVRQSPNVEAGWLSRINLFLVPNNVGKNEKNK